MSTTTKWVLGIIIIAALAILWWSGYLGSSAPATPGDGQSAAVMNSSPQSNNADISDSVLLQDIAAVDAQLKAVNPESGAAVAVPAMQNVMTAMRALQTKFNLRVANLAQGTVKTNLQATLKDLTVQLSNASSHTQAASQKPTSTAAAREYLLDAYGELTAARADIATVATALKTAK